MSDIICVTNRSLCQEDFLTRIRRIAECAPKAIILREKDLPESDYCRLAEKVMGICDDLRVDCILHSFYRSAAALGCKAVHLPLPVLRLSPDLSAFSVIGSSCHSPSDAAEAVRLGATYVTAGHVFQTDCKKGLPPRGLGFLSEVCRSVDVPVFAIGGISPENISSVINAGAAGGCIMSGLMNCDPDALYHIFGK